MDSIYAAAAALLILGGFSVISLLLWLRRLVGKLESTIKSHANLLDSATVSSSRLDTVIASSGRMDSAIESLSNHIGRKLVEIESKNDILLSHLLNVDVKLFDANENTNLFNRLVERRLNRLHASLDFVRTRLTTYLGNCISITYISGDIPIYINSNDDGGPTDLINGRDYESGNLSVILSFLAPDSIFLDIGANIGYFTIFAGMHTERTQAKILSFEPNPEMFELLNRSVEVNGLSGRVTTHPFGLAASDEVVSFIIPRHHAGGGHVLRSYGDGQPTGSNTQTRDPMTTRLRVRVKRLDEIVGPEFISDLAKIDVEGGEADVLIGMAGVIARSPDLKIVLEKFVRDHEYNQKLWTTLKGFSLFVYSISEEADLKLISSYVEFLTFNGYVLATKKAVSDGLQRARVSIYPEQLLGNGVSVVEGVLTASARGGQILFYGPYWPFRAGLYQVVVDADITGKVHFTIAERFGHYVTEFKLENGRGSFGVDRDLTRFECVARAHEGSASISLRRIDIFRVG